MGSEWRVVELGQIVDIRTGKLDSNAARMDGEYPFFTCSPEPLRIDNYAYDEDAILLAGNNANGIFHVNRYNGKFNAYQRTYIITVTNESEVFLDFIYYHLKTIGRLLESLSVGTATKFLTMKILSPLEINLPPFHIQKKIAQSLSSLDNKIEVNRQMNTTLEAMAQALFKSWFVDFDPVIDNALAAGNPIPDELAARAESRAKAAQQQSSEHPHTLPAAIRQQFPDRFVFTETMGWVPEGWEVPYLKDIANIAYGKNLATSKLHESGFPVFGGNGVIGYYDKFLYETPQVLVACRGAASGKVLRSLPFSYVTNNSLVIEHGMGKAPFEYLYFSLLNQDLTTYTSGSAQPQMTVANMNPVQILLPTKPLLTAFAEQVSVVFGKCLEIDQQSDVLSSIRDTLLPKLLSGQLRIPEAEQLLAEVN